MRKIFICCCLVVYSISASSQKLFSLKLPTKTSGGEALPFSEVSDNCKLSLITGITFKQEDDNKYSCIFEDAQGEAITYFFIEQLNRALFYDKFKESVKSLCDDTEKVDSFVKTFKPDKPEDGVDLYTKFLEQKDKFDNTNEKAGTLIIKRRVWVRNSDDKSSKSIRDANDIKAIKAEAEKYMQSATRLKNKLLKMKEDAYKVARTNADSVMAIMITGIANDVEKKVDSAKSFYDSVNNLLPNNKILEYYRRAVELSKNAQDIYKNAVKKINEANAKFQNFKNILKNMNGGEKNLYVASFCNYTENKDALAVNTNIYRASLVTYRDSLLQQLLSTKTNQPENQSLINLHDLDSLPSGGMELPGTIGLFTVYEIQIQFQDGFIENIRVLGKMEGDQHMYKFENIYPIRFSTKKDYRGLMDHKLIENSDHASYPAYYLRLGDVISYNPEFANDNKDYAPANQVLTVDKIIDSTKEIVLYKEQTFRILEAKIFSDLKGADNNNPNGLIQVELSKRLNFLSSRHALYKNIGNYGFFNFVTPMFAINKVETNMKRLILSPIETLSLAADSSKALTYTSTINLLRHQIYNVGFDFSILLYDFPGIKSTFNLGTGVYFSRTAMQDTIRTRTQIDPTHYSFAPIAANNVIEFGVNNFQWGPFITWQIFPDKRFGVSATQRFTWFKALSSEFRQVRDSAHYLKYIAATDKYQLQQVGYDYYNYGARNGLLRRGIPEKFSLFTRCIASTEIFAYFNPNSTGANKLFFRYRLNWDLANAKENFHQLQVGFSTYISSTKEVDKLRKNSNF